MLVATCAGALALAGPIALARAQSPAPEGPAARNAEPPLAPPLPHAPLTGTLSLTDGYGAARSNHFHAGVDLSTGAHTGEPVFAPLPGWIERVRASGVGYGRSLYLHGDDGRLIVLGHLDAFSGRLAAYVDSAQRASAQYEVDLWPAAGRFRVPEGALLAWSGESGAGGPHLHIEIRHGDFALDPLRAGLRVADTIAPTLEALTLEPLDGHSFVARGPAPHTVTLAPTAAAETVVVEGRVRAIVRARDAGAGARELTPWSVALEWGDETVEARLDSISWAGEMSQLDLLMDRGRIVGGDGLVLYSEAGPRARFLRTSRPDSLAAGELRVEPGAPARALRLRVRDADGNADARTVWLRGPRAGEMGPDTLGAHGTAAAAAVPTWAFAILPDKWLRVRVTGAPAGLANVHIERARESHQSEDAAPAVWDGGGWCAVLRSKGVPDEDGFWIKGRAKDGKAWWERGAWMLWPAGADLLVTPSDFERLALGADNTFGFGVIETRALPAEDDRAHGLVAVTPAVEHQPALWPLRKPATLSLQLPEGARAEHVGLYQRTRAGEPWSWQHSTYDSTTRYFVTETPALGTFALLRDTISPLLEPLPAPRTAVGSAYSRWALEARASDAGSGIDAGASAFTVDGVRVPTEYDPEAGELRWRPLAPPARGSHTFEVAAVDHAGNRTIRRGSFVVAFGK